MVHSCVPVWPAGAEHLGVGAKIDAFPSPSSEMICLHSPVKPCVCREGFTKMPAFSKSSLNIWNFMVRVLLKPGLENLEHYFTSM